MQTYTKQGNCAINMLEKQFIHQDPLAATMEEGNRYNLIFYMIHLAAAKLIGNSHQEQ